VPLSRDRVDMGVEACAEALTVRRDAAPSVFTITALKSHKSEEWAKCGFEERYHRRQKMFELYGMGKDGMVYRSPPPRRKEVDILEVGETPCLSR